MPYKGRYTPLNPKKYRGNPTTIIYRSLMERRFMRYCDTHENIIQWNSEECVIPYVSPIDRRIHRYFVDFYMKVRTQEGTIKEYLVEVKPKKQTKPPPRTPTKKTKRWYGEVKTWGVNEAKWKAATEFAKDRQWNFVILTEEHLK